MVVMTTTASYIVPSFKNILFPAVVWLNCFLIEEKQENRTKEKLSPAENRTRVTDGHIHH